MKVVNPSQHRARDRYLDLVKAFPLRPIRSQTDCTQAMSVLEPLVVRDQLDAGEEDYVAVLTGLIEQYESSQAEIPNATAREVLRHYMHIRQMRTADLGRILGNSSLASAILSGKRQISKSHAKLLAEYFNVNVGLFID